MKYLKTGKKSSFFKNVAPFLVEPYKIMKILLNILKYLPIIEAKGVIKRRYQHPDAVSYTPESKDGLMLLIKPSFSFENIRGICGVARSAKYVHVLR